MTPQIRASMRRLLAPGRRQDGYADAAILYPFLVVLTLTIIQVALYAHASNVASAAATIGFNASHGHGATVTDGRTAAEDFLAIRHGELLDTAARVNIGADVTVEVTGRAPSIIPGLDILTIRASHTGPLERWTD